MIYSRFGLIWKSVGRFPVFGMSGTEGLYPAALNDLRPADCESLFLVHSKLKWLLSQLTPI